MKNFLLLFLFQLIALTAFNQPYVPFVDIPAHWNILSYYYPNNTMSTYQYVQDGDTMLNERGYHKLYYQFVDQPATRIFIGGLREDMLKHIYFLPANP